MTDKFPEAFRRYLEGYISIRNKGISDFQVLLNDVENWGIKSPRGGITYNQTKSLAVEARKENLANIYITETHYIKGKNKTYMRINRRDLETGLYVTVEGETKHKTPEITFDGKYYRDEFGHFASKPLRKQEVI